MTDSAFHHQIESRLITLGQRLGTEPVDSLRHPFQANMLEWTGADVRITSDFTYEPDSFLEAHDILVRTHHARTAAFGLIA